MSAHSRYPIFLPGYPQYSRNTTYSTFKYCPGIVFRNSYRGSIYRCTMAGFISKLFGFLFGLVFAGAGTFFIWQTSIPTYLNWQEMRQWQPAEAELLKVGGSQSNTTALYRYDHHGFIYSGSRVYVADFNDSIGSYQQKLKQKLNRSLASNAPIPIWINPDNPAEAIIDKEMRWGLFSLMSIFCSIFIVIGLTVSWFSLKARTKSSIPRAQLKQLRKTWLNQHVDGEKNESFSEYLRKTTDDAAGQSGESNNVSNQSWKNKPEWADSHITSEAKSRIKLMWGIALVTNIVSWPLMFAIQDELHKGNHLILLALAFPLIGIIFLYKAINTSLEYRRFGIVTLSLDPYPGSIGGHVGGSLDIKQRLTDSSMFTIELNCIYSHMSGSGDSRRRHEDIKWGQSGTPELKSISGGTRLSFRFDIPDTLPESDVEKKTNYYLWRITVTGNIPGTDFKRNYIIPVFATAEESRFVHHDISRQVEQRRKDEATKSAMAISRGDFDNTKLSRVIRVKKTGRMLQLYFPMFRNKMLTAFAIIFGGGFGFATFQIITIFGTSTLTKILSGTFSIPFALVALVGTTGAIYLPLNNLKVTIGKGIIRIQRRLLFLPIYMKSLNHNDITGLTIKRTGSTGQGSKQIVHFKVLMHAKSAGSYTIAEDIDGEDLANQLKEYLWQRIRSGI